MNLKLKKVVKNNVVDYGTPDEISKGFEYKFQLLSIIKDYKKFFGKKIDKSPKQKTNPITERQSVSKKYYKKILFNNKNIFRLKNLRNNFKKTHIINNENHLYNINHMNDIYRIEKSQKMQFKSPFIESFYNNKTSESFWKSNKINDKNLFENRFKTNESEKMIYNYNYDYPRYKKFNDINIKGDYFRLKYKDYIKRRKSQLDIKKINSFNKNIERPKTDSLKINKEEKRIIKPKEFRDENYSEYFQSYDFDNYKTIKQLNKKYHFYHSKEIDIEDINTHYFLLLKNMLNNDPGVSLHFDLKESQRKVNKMKNTRYFLRKIIK